MSRSAHALPRLATTLRRFAADERGAQLIEFAFMLPVILMVGGYGIEQSNLALVNLKISQYALNLADNASRVGVDAGAGVTSLREADVNDVLQGTRLESDGIKLTTYGRVTLSSLENTKQSYDTAYKQRIHWQRCIGLRTGSSYESTYGTTTTTDGTTPTAADAGQTSTGMGDPGAKVNAPKDGGVMFVEINYDYQPLFDDLFVPTRRIHYVASFVVRDNRDFSQIFNLSPAATRSTCDRHTA